MPRAIALGILASDIRRWPPSTDKMIDIVSSALRGWYLDHARNLVKSGYDNGGFAALAIASAYFETVGWFNPGQFKPSEPGRQFKRGMQLVFPQLTLEGKDFAANTGSARVDAYINEMVEILWQDLRCAIYHDLSTGSRIALTKFEDGNVLRFSLTYPDRKKARKRWRWPASR